jgi:hypothetical protein
LYLVQLLLPRYDRDVQKELADRFGGVTAYARAPAKGVWKPRRGKTEKDDIVVYEIMVKRLERRWWARYRASLEARFDQEEVVIRAQAMEKL